MYSMKIGRSACPAEVQPQLRGVRPVDHIHLLRSVSQDFVIYVDLYVDHISTTVIFSIWIYIHSVDLYTFSRSIFIWILYKFSRSICGSYTSTTVSFHNFKSQDFVIFRETPYRSIRT